MVPKNTARLAILLPYLAGKKQLNDTLSGTDSNAEKCYYIHIVER